MTCSEINGSGLQPAAMIRPGHRRTTSISSPVRGSRRAGLFLLRRTRRRTHPHQDQLDPIARRPADRIVVLFVASAHGRSWQFSDQPITTGYVRSWGEEPSSGAVKKGRMPTSSSLAVRVWPTSPPPRCGAIRPSASGREACSCRSPGGRAMPRLLSRRRILAERIDDVRLVSDQNGVGTRFRCGAEHPVKCLDTAAVLVRRYDEAALGEVRCLLNIVEARDDRGLIRSLQLPAETSPMAMPADGGRPREPSPMSFPCRSDSAGP